MGPLKVRAHLWGSGEQGSGAGGAAAIVRAAKPQLQKTGSLNKIQKNKDVH